MSAGASQFGQLRGPDAGELVMRLIYAAAQTGDNPNRPQRREHVVRGWRGFPGFENADAGRKCYRGRNEIKTSGWNRWL